MTDAEPNSPVVLTKKLVENRVRYDWTSACNLIKSLDHA